MFNLVKYRYAFLLFSMVIIVPGFISLVLFHLNVGIDFSNGSNLELRPQQTLTAAQLGAALKSLNLGDQQVLPGSNKTIAANKTIWVKLDTQIPASYDTIIKDVQSKYGSTTSVSSYDIPKGGGKYYTLVTISNFSTVPTLSDIKTLLAKLPPIGSTATPTPTATVAATATAKATTTATATPAATTTATATPAVTTNTSGTPVNVVDVKQGSVVDILTIQTTTPLKEADVSIIQGLILQHGGPYVQVISNSTVGPAVAQETTLYAITAVLAASAFILLYVWYSFRKLPKAYRYGACAIIAMLHDVLVVVGIFSILGKYLGIQVDALFITALLTIVGFSVHDTIVVFDRVRENLTKRTSETFEEVVNASLVQTMARSLNTSLTVLFTLLTLTLFTGEGSVHNFTLALLIGIFSGTYSSIFNASMLLVIWEKGELGFNHLGGNPEPVRRGRERELASTRG